MKVIQWGITGVLFIYFLGVAATNARTILRYYLRGEKGSSLPIFGGLAGVAAFLIVPINGARAWCWLPLVFDFWTLPTLFFWLRSRIKGGGDHNQG
jgi:hypothetical protein